MMFRGDLRLVDLSREFQRRRRAVKRLKVERQNVDRNNASPARLTDEPGSLSSKALLARFRDRTPSFFPITCDETRERVAKLQADLFPDETAVLIESAELIARDSSWELAGFGPMEFSSENVWRRDPITGKDWGTDFHADIIVYQNDGSDIRVLWELNRFGHAVTLGCAFAVTGDEAYAETFFSQIEDWMRQNPYGRGANWNCAMEAALRSINLLVAFDIFRRSKACTEERLMKILQLFDQHGRFIFDNNEFSYISTSNHYLSNAAGLFWIGSMLPELENAQKWCEFGWLELLSEIDKQILQDGANFEASTGYHKFVTEILLYSFLLAERVSVEIPEKSRRVLFRMIEFIFGIIRPDGRVPLIGDADGSQIVPVVRREADDQSYLLALAAVYFDEPRFKASSGSTPELLWFLGENSVDAFRSLAVIAAPNRIDTFPDAGSYVLGERSLYLHLNANDCGLNGRGSHAHNDALSIEVSAYGVAFIVDPGSYVYNLDREARHRFRSTAYHSTIEIDRIDQNTTIVSEPFIMGNEAKPRLLGRESTPISDVIVAEHYGYSRLESPVIHRRTIEFLKSDLYWTIEDHLIGEGEHDLRFRFHFAEGIDVSMHEPTVVEARCPVNGDTLHVSALDCPEDPEFERNYVSRTYGSKTDSVSVCWAVTARLPATFRWLINPFPQAVNEDWQGRIG